MTDTILGLTEVTVFAACIIWACSLAFVRNKLGLWKGAAHKRQIVILRLTALLVLACAVKISLNIPPVPALAMCVMLLSLNSIIVSLLLCFVNRTR